jgi:polysaccharide biosynthesis protein PslH
MVDGGRRTAIFLTHHVPWPARNGGTVREVLLLERLSVVFDIHLVTVSRSTPETSGRPSGLRLASESHFSSQAAHSLLRRRRSDAARAHVRDLMARHVVDVIHLEGGYMAECLDPKLPGRACVIEHNIESEILRQFQANGLLPAPSEADVASVEEAEERVWQQAAALCVLTAEDRELVRARTPSIPVHLSPNGADHLPAPSQLRRPPDGPNPRFGFLANFDYAPNAEGLIWFLRHVAPLIPETMASGAVTVYGGGMAPELRRECEGAGVRLTGFVPDLAEAYDAIDVLVAPLVSGGGIKVKILEALRGGLPIVTTSIGAQGVSPQGRRVMFVADAVTAFADCMALAASTTRGDEARRARLDCARALPTWEDSAASLLEVWHTLADPTVRSALHRHEKNG